MKQVFLIVLSSFALSGWGQTALAPAKEAAGSESGSRKTVMVQGADGTWHKLQTPVAVGQLQGLVQNAGSVDLERNVASQAGCPVQIVDASFKRPAQLMLTSQPQTESGPTLRLNYRNFSGKDIESIVLTGWIKVKDSPYQLDSVTHPFDLTLSRKSLLSKDVEASEALKLAGNAIGLDRIELARVMYGDGTTWQAIRSNCVYHLDGNLERAEAR